MPCRAHAVHISCRVALIHTYHAAPMPCRVNSHIPCRAHAVPLPCRAALIHACHASPLPFSDSAVSFVKVRVVDGNIRTASPATTLYSNNIRGTPRPIRKKPNAGRSPRGRHWTADANSRMPYHAHAALCRGLEKSLSERHGHGMARARHSMCESNTAALCKSNEKDTI
jgi:hypothetical protein